MELYIYCLLLSFVRGHHDEIISGITTNEDITLTCSNKHSRKFCQWQLATSQGTFVDIAASIKHQNQATTIMTIKSFSIADRGSYRCKCYDKSGRFKYSSSITIEIADVQTKYRLHCGHAGTDYIWKRKANSHYNRIYTNKKYITNTTSDILIVKNVYWDEEGIYRCTHYHSGWHDVDYYLVVKDIRVPMMYIPTSTYPAKIGGNILLKCTVRQTLPQTTEVWWTLVNSRGRQVLQGSEGQKYQGGTLTNPSLKILNVTERDSGEYKCHGKNKHGETSVATQLITGNKPRPPKTGRSINTVREGMAVTLSCTPHVSDTDLTVLWWQIKWFGERFNSINYYKNKYSGGNLLMPNLTIKTVYHQDETEYRCNVANSFGTSYVDTKVKIGSSPTVRVKASVYSPVRGETIILVCNFNNADKIWWKRIENGQEKPVDTTRTSGESTQSLTVHNVEQQDDGEYRCYGSNDISSTSGIINLVSGYIPLVTTTRTTVKGNKGVDTVLPCSHDSNPKPKDVYWTKNGFNISAYMSTKYNGSTIEFPSLVIHDTEKSDSGTYICSVSNKLGIGYSKPLQLLIRERGDSAIGLHFNSRPMSSVAADDRHSSTRPIVAVDAEYHNVSDVTSTCIRVEDLKTYIQKRQRHEELKKEYKSIPNIAEHPTTHAQTKDNMPKNRFKTTFPYDHTRVILKSDGGSDYINANYIDGFEKERCYIASQGPVKNTVADHWKMIWQENIHQIVMVTNLVEGIKTKCEQYWPCGGKQMVHGNLIIRLTAEKERTAYVTREITIEDKKSGKKRYVTQYHFTAWPDHGTPDPLYLVLFHRHVMSDSKAGHAGPLLVHCSAGIGRTGTYIALDALLEEGRTTGFVDIFKFLKKMRYSRMNMIQTSNQYVCLHYALLEAFTMKDTKIRKDEFSQVWQSIRTDQKALNHQRLNKEFKMLNATKDDQNQNQYNAAMSTTNLAKNRNKDVLPMDDKRVYLVSYGKGRSDYINAVQVPSYTKFVGYITTQLPLPDTKLDFWTMIRDHSSSTIVLIINKANEADFVYSQSGDDLTIGPFGIKISARQKGENDITKITMVLSRKDDKPRQVVLFQAICNSTPDPAVLGKLADLISTRATISNDPITVVSSDGAKNCGLFCVLTNAVSSMQIDNNADIFQLVRLLQLRRPEFFTDFEEYKRCYEALQVHLESANVYANF
ncbi:receptor-type tyrosine-protein phosphatase alpha-like isoform X2 [Mytilus trossulus]|uniref:receptor-type tyrosine-protein phosphatase alpha-like isoform X2 n=1 Tax=Mytilus trossulus TaxID=6551 RepID=UPI0030066A7B